MEYLISSILLIAAALLFVFMWWEDRTQNDYEKSMEEHYDFEEADIYK